MLVQRLLAAKRELRLPQEIAKLQQVGCLILDDIGYVQQDRDEMEVLFTLLAERYEQRSVLITTNLVFSAWSRIFKDPMTTLAAVDRVVHHSVILDMAGVESFRATQAREDHTPWETAVTATAGVPPPSSTPSSEVSDVSCSAFLISFQKAIFGQCNRHLMRKVVDFQHTISHASFSCPVYGVFGSVCVMVVLLLPMCGSLVPVVLPSGGFEKLACPVAQARSGSVCSHTLSAAGCPACTCASSRCR